MMGVSHTEVVRDTINNTVLPLLDVSVGNAVLKFYDSGDAILGAEFIMSKPSFSPSVSGVSIALGTLQDIATVASTINHFHIETGDNDPLIYGTISETGNGGDIELSTVTLPDYGSITISSLTYEATP